MHTPPLPPARREERGAEIQGLLAAEDLQARYGTIPEVRQFIDGGQVTAEQVVAAARSRRDADQARLERQQRVEQLLQAEGLQESFGYLVTSSAYVRLGTGSEEDVLQAVRDARDQSQRREAVVAALVAIGLEGGYYGVTAASEYIDSGTGSVEAAVAAVQAQRELEQQRAARRQALRDALAAAQLADASLWSVTAATRYIDSGAGSVEGAVDAVRASHQKSQQRIAREASVNAALQAEALGPLYFWCVAGCS